MRSALSTFVFLAALLLTTKSGPCHGLCRLTNSTAANCHDLEDVKYIDTYDLENLKTSFSGNRLYAGIFQNFSSLKYLDLSYGEIENIEPGTFRQLPDLRSLDLSHNHLASLASTSLDGLKKLRILNIRKNTLKHIPDEVLNLKHLKVLDLVGNPLDCDCANLKVRDTLLDRGVYLSKRVLCSSPDNLKNNQLLELDVNVICLLEEQDKDMQGDEPAIEGTSEISPVDSFEGLTSGELDGDVSELIKKIPVTSAPEVETPTPVETSPQEQTTSPIVAPSSQMLLATVTEVPLEMPTATDEETSFSEHSDKHMTSTASSLSTKIAEEITEDGDVYKKEFLRELVNKDDHALPVEGSAEEAEQEIHEGSGIEGSGTGVPPISWDMPDDETVVVSTSSESSAKTTETGWFGIIWDAFAGTTEASVKEPKPDLGLEEEEFINMSSESPITNSPKTHVDEEVIVPSVVSGSDGSLGKTVNDSKATSAVEVGQVLDDAKSGKVQVENEGTVESADASPARQSKKGMGSYVVLAALLAVLGVLIGFAAYKGDFCRKKRKRNDVEGGTELKDMSKSLLEPANGNQPKIAANGNMENVPLVCSLPTKLSKKQNDEDGSLPDALEGTYSAISDVVDPVKPPRKSYASEGDAERGLTNGRSHQDLTNSSGPIPAIREPVCLRTNGASGDPTGSGKNHNDSLSSLGTDFRDSQSVRTSRPNLTPTNGSLGTLQGYSQSPLSPGAQKVKITLQDNPDSVPKTPILITRIKGGENLVKTP